METVEIASRLRSVLENRLTERLNKSALYVDIADIYEISQWYVAAIETLLSGPKTNDQLETELIEIQTEVLLHLKLHVNSLTKTLPRAIKHIGKTNGTLP